MEEMGWGITFVLVLATLVTVLASTVIVQVFKTKRLAMQVKAGNPEGVLAEPAGQ